MKARLTDTHPLVLKSRSSAKIKVKYQGHISQKMVVSGGISVSQTHLVYFENRSAMQYARNVLSVTGTINEGSPESNCKMLPSV